MEGNLDRRSEATGPAFSETLIAEVRRSSWKALHAAAARIEPGMTEAQGLEVVVEALAALGCKRHWHRPHVRFGVNTTKTYAEPAEPGVVLGATDLFFLDLGPVFGGLEGDVGCTFLVGKDAERERCLRDGRNLFRQVKHEWSERGLTGRKLYEFAEAKAEELGWKLVGEGANGHRLSEFPHSLHFKGPLSGVELTPASHKWVLEIQLRHPELLYGSFHEDLLVDDSPLDPFTA